MAPSAEPREDAIADVGSITGLRREDAVRWLKAYDNDANKAMDAFLENPNAIHDQQSQVKFDEQQGQKIWEEDHFHVDRVNNYQQGQDYQGIHASDALRPNVFSDGAPSRPPSRVSGRPSRVDHGANQDLEMETEDEQLKRAMAISMNDSQTLPDQESGILETNGFGPATREHYETEKWAMTVTGPQTQEILLDPEPSDRIRAKGTPAFLKPSPVGHRLPSLLTILHAIPMAREALLNRTHTLPDYGYEKDWWTGSAIQTSSTITIDREGNPTYDRELIYEVQRLISFLDQTDRAYGSIDGLAKPGVTEHAQNIKITDFYIAWHQATMSHVADAPIGDVFESLAEKESLANGHSEKFYSLTVRVDGEIAGKGMTLYDVLDQVLWSDNQDDEQTYLGKVGEIVTMEVSNQVASIPGLGISIPSIWYADRYLKASTTQVKDMLSRKSELSAAMEAQEKVRALVKQYPNPTGNANVEIARLLATAARHVETTIEYRDTIPNGPEIDSRIQAGASSSVNLRRTAEDLNQLSKSISVKLLAFEKAQEQGREQLREVSQMYTKPKLDTEEPPHHRYTLCGVSTTSHTTYVLERTKREMKDNELTDTHAWQWWKLEFVRNDVKPVVVLKVTEDDVLKAASTESRDALLVYASISALSYQCDELPSQLRNFVRADNLTFGKEFDGPTYQQPNTPTKRPFHDEDSEGFADNRQRWHPPNRDFPETVTGDEVLDPDLPHYASHQSRISIVQPNQRADTVQSGDARSFDDVIPTSLQPVSIATDHIDCLGDEEGMRVGQEMQERSGGRQSFLGHQGGGEDSYSLGSYVPEFRMENDRDQSEPRGA